MENAKMSVEEFILSVYDEFETLTITKGRIIEALRKLQGANINKQAQIDALKAEVAKLQSELETMKKSKKCSKPAI